MSVINKELLQESSCGFPPFTPPRHAAKPGFWDILKWPHACHFPLKEDLTWQTQSEWEAQWVDPSDKLRTVQIQSSDCISKIPECGGAGDAEVPWGLQAWGRPAGTPVAVNAQTCLQDRPDRMRSLNTCGCWVTGVVVKAFVLFTHFPSPTRFPALLLSI